MTVINENSGVRQEHGNAGSTAQPIAFIPNESFEDTSESDLLGNDVEYYEHEDPSSGTLDPETVAASLLSALQRSRLLTFEGEQLLFKQLNFLRFRANAIQTALNAAKPSSKKVREMERLLTEAATVREKLAQSNLRLVASIAGKLAMSREEFDEFVAEGNGILLYAIDKFDYGRGYRFSTYVTHAVQRHLYRFINRRRKRAEREFSRNPELLLNEVTAEADPDLICAAESRQAAAAIISKIDETLNERERFIVRGRFGLDGSGQGKTYRVLAEQLGLSKERVRQVFQQGIEKLGEIARPFESVLATA
ncbi:MAG: sigma-70 family RNA polymerase sigma factor [Planctomycetaceae bacterium]